MHKQVVCPEHGEFPCMIVEDQPIGCAVAGATHWLASTYIDPDETAFLVELMRDELVKAWRRNIVLGECIKQHLVEQSALVDRSARKVAQA